VRNRFGGRGSATLGLLLLGALGCGPDVFDDAVEQNQVAHTLRFVVQPSNARAGEVMRPIVEVEVVDASGHRVRGLETFVNLQLPSRTQAGNLQGFSVFTRDGRGSFPYLAVVHPGAYELEASSFGLESKRSQSFTITPAVDAAPESSAEARRVR